MPATVPAGLDARRCARRHAGLNARRQTGLDARRHPRRNPGLDAPPPCPPPCPRRCPPQCRLMPATVPALMPAAIPAAILALMPATVPTPVPAAVPALMPAAVPALMPSETDDWTVFCGSNGLATPTNFLFNGVPVGIKSGGSSPGRRGMNFQTGRSVSWPFGTSTLRRKRCRRLPMH